MEELKIEAARHGDKLAAISSKRLADVKLDFDKLNIDTSPYYCFEPPGDLGFDVHSVLVVASPSPPATVYFNEDSGEKKVVIPPTYADMDEKEGFINHYLQTIVQEKGLHAVLADRLPCKPIAVHAGLGLYGRNNIVYVDNTGSFVSIFLFFSDITCEYECFYPLSRMDCCEGCKLCTENCPTSALTYENDLVNDERCLTMLNEYPGDFPSWLEPEWHNALIGCVKCQFACPQNKEYINYDNTIANYSREQTRAFINGELPEEMLKPLGLKHYNKILSRNLKVLLNHQA